MTKKKRTDWVFIAGIVCMMLIIGLLHSSITLKKITEPPSAQWGRAIKLGEATVVSAPFLKTIKGGTEIVWAADNGIHQAILDEKGNITKNEIVKPSYMNFTKLIAYQQAGDTFGWLEGSDLKITTLISENSIVKNVNDFLKDGIRDFKLFKSNDKLYLTCISKSELAVFRIEGGNLVPLATQLLKSELVNVSMNVDDLGNPIIIYAIKTGEADFSLMSKRLNKDGTLSSIMKAHNFTTDSMTSSGTENLESIDSIFDGEKLWLAYETGISSSRNMQGKVYLGSVLPNGSERTKDIDFKRFTPPGVSIDNTIVKDFSFIKDANNGYVKAYFGIAEKSSDEMRIMEMDLSTSNPKLTAMSNNGGWNKYPTSIITDDGTGAAYLKVVGGQNFEVYYTGDYETYKSSVNKASWNDIKMSISNNLIYVIIASMLIIFNIPYFLLLIFLLVFLQAFKERWIEKSYDLALILSGFAHLAIKAVVFTKMLGPNVVKEMPTYLSGGFAFFATYTIITTASFALVYFHVRKEVDRNLPKEYFMAMVIDLMVSMFLMGPFVFDKI